jgi:superfamily II DNA or RNA helicase
MSVTVTKKDEVYLKIHADPDVMFELNDIFTFAVPGAQFTPAFRHKMWDGKIRLLNIHGGELYIGLLPYVKKYCEKNELEFIDKVSADELDQELTAELDSFIEELNYHSKGIPIEIREYQRKAVHDSLNKYKNILLSPTASGKSLIIYTLIRWHQKSNRKQLIIVPTTSLVEQMYKDFADYASETDWKVEDNCTRIYAGKEKQDRPITISTWQSLHRLPKSYFQDFDVVFGDEAHLFAAKSLTSIMTKCVNAKYKVGTTGTLDDAKTHRMVLEGLFGAENKVTTTRQLMDANQLAELKITCIQLMYPDADRKLVKKFTYQEEIDWLIAHSQRNKFIRNLVVSQKGNTLMLFNYVEKHGKVLYEMIQEKVSGDRKVFFVHGGVVADDRETIRELTETETNAIIVASLGTFSTGINIRNLHNIVFASPTKSRIRNLQSIGRGLRIGDQKTICKLYDIGDDLSWKSHKNYTLNHMVERIKIYNEELFDYKMVSVQLT